jgi:hypothetical protein
LNQHQTADHVVFRRLLLGAGIAAKESATFLNCPSSLLNLAAVEEVTSINSPLPTTDADMYAFLSLIPLIYHPKELELSTLHKKCEIQQVKNPALTFLS